MTNHVILDLETAARLDADAVIPVVDKAPGNYSKPEAIQKYIAEANAKRLESAATNINFSRIVVLGAFWSADTSPILSVCPGEVKEQEALRSFWLEWLDAGRPTIIGFFNSRYDVPLLVRRSQVLEIPYPELELTRYRHKDVIDLAEILTFGWNLDAEKLDTYSRVFGIEHDDSLRGKDIPALVAENTPDAWRLICDHCDDDLWATRRLANRLGVL